MDNTKHYLTSSTRCKKWAIKLNLTHNCMVLPQGLINLTFLIYFFIKNDCSFLMFKSMLVLGTHVFY